MIVKRVCKIEVAMTSSEFLQLVSHFWTTVVFYAVEIKHSPGSV